MREIKLSNSEYDLWVSKVEDPSGHNKVTVKINDSLIVFEGDRQEVEDLLNTLALYFQVAARANLNP